MIAVTVQYIDVSAKITFSDGRTLQIISSVDYETSDGDASDIADMNELVSLNIEESVSSTSASILGNVSSNTLSLDINSYNKSLFPNNTESPYYKYMNDSAVISLEVNRIYFDTEDQPEVTDDNSVMVLNPPLPLGTFYVNEWKNTVDVDNTFLVHIEGLDLLSSISKRAVPKIKLSNKISLEEYFILLLDELNRTAESKGYEKINYVKSDISFGSFGNNPRLWNLNTSGNVGDLFSQISKSTLTNIYIDRNNVLCTDYLFDDAAKDSVCTFSESTNIDSISNEDGLLAGYRGVKVKYKSGVISNDRLGSSEDLVINKKTDDDTSTKFSNMSLTDNTFKATYVCVTGEEGESIPEIKRCVYDNSRFTLIMKNNEEKHKVGVDIYGQTKSSNYKSLDTTIIKNDGTYADDEDDTRSTYKCENNIVDLPDSVKNYQSKLIKFMKYKKSSLTCSGFFSPQIKLGDEVIIDSDTVESNSNIYKIVRMNWKLDDEFICDVELLKIIKS